MGEYEQLVNWDEFQPIAFSVHSLEDLPRVLIKARIASKISQSSLALALGISLKELQRSEDRDYEAANLTQLLEVSRVLKIEFQLPTVQIAS